MIVTDIIHTCLLMKDILSLHVRIKLWNIEECVSTNTYNGELDFKKKQQNFGLKIPELK